ncbi:IPP transferase-domain-containing protein [Myxozyma melibiosi]|uniref:tRNA dimethylallyltransferase n=1 Tax=Myxozyma melibiosi TaxID=54550 RepID=A0ABR1FE61_9ASCO
MGGFSSTLAQQARKSNLISVIGTTGVGKSKLSVSLALKLNGEIINGDSMQMYKGLDTMTNKHPLEERFGVEHHLLGHIDDLTAQYTVKQFETEAEAVVDKIERERRKLPILVGGTHYYIQSFLFTNKTVAPERELTSQEAEFLETAETKEIFEKLKELDPVVSQKFHPRDRRKLATALKVCFTTSRRASDIYKEQSAPTTVNQSLTRYRNLVFWLWCEPDTLDTRLDARVDTMLERGNLLGEVKQMSDLYRTLDPPPSMETGVWQVIGFKEFLPFVSSQAEDDKVNGLEDMKRVTRKYADKQVRWIRKRMLAPAAEAGDDATIVVLDATDLSKWKENVEDKAVEISRAFLNGESIPQSARAPAHLSHLLQLEDTTQPGKGKWEPEKWKHYECDLCVVDGEKFVCLGEEQWKTHLRQKRHVKRVKRIKEQEAFERWKAKKAAEAQTTEEYKQDP